jgi:hypothetical protein
MSLSEFSGRGRRNIEGGGLPACIASKEHVRVPANRSECVAAELMGVPTEIAAQ